MDMLETVKFHGYPVLQYKVTTEDGYILTLHRMPGKRGQKAVDALREKKKTVLLAHGFLMNSQCWVTSGAAE